MICWNFRLQKGKNTFTFHRQLILNLNKQKLWMQVKTAMNSFSSCEWLSIEYDDIFINRHRYENSIQYSLWKVSDYYINLLTNVTDFIYSKMDFFILLQIIPFNNISVIWWATAAILDYYTFAIVYLKNIFCKKLTDVIYKVIVK